MHHYGVGKVEFTVDDGILNWKDKNISKPSKTELAQWWSELVTYEESISYKTKRVYAPKAEQLDALYRDIENGTVDTTGEFYTMNLAVKEAYPKPEE